MKWQMLPTCPSLTRKTRICRWIYDNNLNGKVWRLAYQGYDGRRTAHAKDDWRTRFHEHQGNSLAFDFERLPTLDTSLRMDTRKQMNGFLLVHDSEACHLPSNNLVFPKLQ